MVSIEPRLRPCYVTMYKRDPNSKIGKLVKDGEEKALFHCWVHKSEAVPPSAMIGGHPGGIISGVLGIVEFESGKVREATPSDIRFVDNMFAEYAWEGE